MATKDHWLPNKTDILFGENLNNEYSNINLNQNNNQSLHYDNLNSKNLVTNDRKVQNYDFTALNDLKAKREESTSWNKTAKNPNFLNHNLGDSEEKDELKKLKNANNSTLSLHIAAYENSAETDSDEFKKEDLKRKSVKTNLIKKWNTSKQDFTDSSLSIQNPFEFPRQQEENQSKVPEIMQFKASQRLRNPNEENLNVNERINASAVQANCPPTSFNLEGSTVPPQQQEQQQQNPSVLSNMSNPPAQLHSQNQQKRIFRNHNSNQQNHSNPSQPQNQQNQPPRNQYQNYRGKNNGGGRRQGHSNDNYGAPIEPDGGRPQDGGTSQQHQQHGVERQYQDGGKQQQQYQHNERFQHNDTENQQNQPPRNQNHNNQGKNNGRGGRRQGRSNDNNGAPVEPDGERPQDGQHHQQHGGERHHQDGGRQNQQQRGGRQQQQYQHGQRFQHNDTENQQYQDRPRQHQDEGRQNQQQHHGARSSRRGGGHQQYYRNYNQYRQNQRPVPASEFNHLIKSRKDHAGVTMSGNVHDCLICCQPSDVFGVGECRHPVCIECCIRMRILGNSESCPQCRSPITMLYFVSAPETWENFTIPTGDITHGDSAKYNIRFTNDYTVKCYDSYLAHSCQICAQNGDKIEFPTFGALRHHTSQTHQRTFCPICIEHLNVLSKDRKAYLKNELDNHMKGTSNEISGQKGHPPCLFCPERFFDDDHLYRHLRQEHFFCQICENDGGHNIFYAKHEELYSHYRKKHHPCLEPDCMAMGIVFKNDLELGVHKASEHGNASRNVNIDFQFSGRNLGNRNFRNGAQNERDYPSVRQERLSVVPSDAPPPSLPSRIVPSAQAQQRQIVPSRLLTNTQDFPTLTPSAPPSSSTATLPNWRQEVQNMRHQPAPSRAPIQISSGEQFPTLVSARGGTSGIAPTAAAQGVKNKTKNPAANTVWGNGKPIQLFTSNNTPPPKVKEPETPRRQFIPLPDIWPEGMRERVEAKMKGLPDPGPQEPEIVDPLFRVEAAKKEKRKAAKKKSKTVPISAYANREQPDDFAQPSKFDALAEVDESKNTKKNKVNKINYTLTSDNTVKIEAAPTLRSVADSIGENKKSSEQIKSKENGTVASTSPKSSSNEVSDFPSLGSSSAGSGFPSLTDIASGLTSFWKGRPNQSSNPPPPSTSSSSNQTTAWSTGPPPGFS